METKKIKGIIISEKPYGESSKLLKIITKEYGTISVLAKGAKRLKSTLRSISTKFTYANFIISYKENRLSVLISADIIDNLKNIKNDIEKISFVNFISELTEQVLKQSNSNDIYDLYIASLKKINDGYNPVIITNILELKYLDYLGVSPELNACVMCNSKNVVTLSSLKGGFVCNDHKDLEYIVSPKTIKIIRMLKYVDISKISKIDISEKIVSEINDFIDDYYDRYTGLYLKSKSFLKSIVKI